MTSPNKVRYLRRYQVRYREVLSGFREVPVLQGMIGLRYPDWRRYIFCNPATAMRGCLRTPGTSIQLSFWRIDYVTFVSQTSPNYQSNNPTLQQPRMRVPPGTSDGTSRYLKSTVKHTFWQNILRKSGTSGGTSAFSEDLNLRQGQLVVVTIMAVRRSLCINDATIAF